MAEQTLLEKMEDYIGSPQHRAQLERNANIIANREIHRAQVDGMNCRYLPPAPIAGVNWRAHEERAPKDLTLDSKPVPQVRPEDYSSAELCQYPRPVPGIPRAEFEDVRSDRPHPRPEYNAGIKHFARLLHERHERHERELIALAQRTLREIPFCPICNAPVSMELVCDQLMFVCKGRKGGQA